VPDLPEDADAERHPAPGDAAEGIGA